MHVLIFQEPEHVVVDLDRNGLVEELHLNYQPQLSCPLENFALKACHDPARHLHERSRFKAWLRRQRHPGGYQSKYVGKIQPKSVLVMDRN